MPSFEVVGTLPEAVSVLFLDIDKTITAGDVLDIKIAKFLVERARERIRVVFVTGRDRIWLIRNLAKVLENMAGSGYKNEVAPFLQYDAELGVVSVDPISFIPEILAEARRNDLVIGTVRERLATLCWQAQKLKPCKSTDPVPPHYYMVKDANDLAFLLPHNPNDIDPAIKLPEFIWSDTKEVIATLEALRDGYKREVPPSIKAIIPSAAKILEALVRHWHMERSIRISAVGTAINITLVVDGVAFDKDWSAGKTLRKISTETGTPVETIARRSLAVGDGRADFLFSRPYLGGSQYGDLAFAFVGSPDQFTDNEKEKQNTVIKPLRGNEGAIVTLDILRKLQDDGLFRPLQN